MIDPTARAHGLETLAGGGAVRIQGELGFVNLRGDAGDSRFGETIEKVLGLPLPSAPNTFTAGEHRLYWLGPDEWLLVTDMGKARAITADLHETLKRVRHAVNNLSGGYVALHLAGPSTRDLLASGCTLDFHPRVFGDGRCAQSSLAKASVLIGLREPPDGFEIIVRRSFSDYLVRWLADAARRTG